MENVDTKPVETENNTDPPKPEVINDEEQQPDDDVPENFFDDFMNEDFIDGLNVVDTWDEEESKKKPQSNEKDKKSPPRKSRSPRRKRQRTKSPRRHRSSDRNEKERDRERERERRDPSKTQRDILKDKDKCAKDQKAKLISEKLKVVETGLVPPGTEMDADIIKLSSSSVTSKLEKIRRSVERNRSLDTDRKRRKSSPERIRRSPIRQRRPQRTRSRSRSPRRISGGSRRSVERRNRRIEDRRDLRRRNSVSRSPRRRRSKTPQSDISERERWLRRRSRSRSPRRNKTFLQELGDKLKPEDKKILLNETLPDILSKSSAILSGFLPTPVPPPQNYIPQTLIIPPQSDYDQQFFIGQSEMGPPMFPPRPIPRPLEFIPPDHMIPLQPTHIPYMMENPQPVPMPPEFIQISPILQTQKSSPSPLLGKDALSKLFNDKKIMLSDYLSLTGKFTDESRPQNIQNKIKVISDCQDVIKELVGELKTLNRFTVRKLIKPEKADLKNQSPLKKIPVVRFQFTNKSKTSEDTPTMATQLSKLLHKFGKEFTFEDFPKAPSIESKNSSTQSPPPPPIIFDMDKVTQSSKKSQPAKISFAIASKNPQPLINATTHAMFTQTERYKCPECEIRYSKVTASSTTQTNDATMTFDVACQVGPEDFPKPKSILKNNQSLASMTPAQLLANARDLQSPPPTSSSKYHHRPLFESPDVIKKNQPQRSFNSPDSFSDYNEFDRYRSETVKGNAIFERDRGPGSSINRDVVFGNAPRNGPPMPLMGYQPRPPGFGYQRSEDGMGNFNPPQQGQTGYRGRDGRWY